MVGWMDGREKEKKRKKERKKREKGWIKRDDGEKERKTR